MGRVSIMLLGLPGCEHVAHDGCHGPHRVGEGVVLWLGERPFSELTRARLRRDRENWNGRVEIAR